MIVRIVSVIAYVVLAPFIGCFLEGLSRNLLARLQGKSSVSAMQSYYDIRKLLQKEKAIQFGSRKVYAWASLIATISAGGVLFYGGDLFMIVFLLIAASLFRTLSVGKERYADFDLMVLPLIMITAIGFHIFESTTLAADIAMERSMTILPMIGLFIVYVCVIANLFRNCYREKATENIGYRGLSQVALVYERVLLLGIVVLFFTNGTVWGTVIGIVAALIVNGLSAFADLMLPAIKERLAVRLFWLICLSLGAANIMVLYLCF